jgi:hypothetical protein
MGKGISSKSAVSTAGSPLPAVHECFLIALESNIRYPVRLLTRQQRQALARYNIGMQFALIAMHILTVVFFLGLAGSSIVVAISFVEDIQELFGE